MANIKGDVDLLEQCIVEGMGDLRGGGGGNRGPSRRDARLSGSHGVTRGVHGFSRQGLECAH